MDYGAAENAGDSFGGFDGITVFGDEAIVNALPDEVFVGEVGGDGLLPDSIALFGFDRALGGGDDVVFGVEDLCGEGARTGVVGVVWDGEGEGAVRVGGGQVLWGGSIRGEERGGGEEQRGKQEAAGGHAVLLEHRTAGVV
jgi:hypothetical protein